MSKGTLSLLQAPRGTSTTSAWTQQLELELALRSLAEGGCSALLFTYMGARLQLKHFF